MSIRLIAEAYPSASGGVAYIGTSAFPTTTYVDVNKYDWVYIRTSTTSGSYVFSEWIFIPSGESVGYTISTSSSDYVQANYGAGTYRAIYTTNATVTWKVYTYQNFVGAPVIANECIEGVGCTTLTETSISTTKSSQNLPVTIYQNIFKYSDVHISDFDAQLSKTVASVVNAYAHIYQLGTQTPNLTIPGYQNIHCFPDFAGDSTSPSYGGYKTFRFKSNYELFNRWHATNNPLSLRVTDETAGTTYYVTCTADYSDNFATGSNVPALYGHKYKLVFSWWFANYYKVDWVGITQYEIFSSTTYSAANLVQTVYYKQYEINSNDTSLELTYGTDMSLDLYIHLSYTGYVSVNLSSGTSGANAQFYYTPIHVQCDIPTAIVTGISSYDTDNYIFGYWTYDGTVLQTVNETDGKIPQSLIGEQGTTHEAIAYFYKKTKTIQYHKVGTGTGSVSMTMPDGLIVHVEDTPHDVSIGDVVTFSATPSSDSTFQGWYKNNVLISSESTYEYTVVKDDADAIVITGSFILKPTYTFTLSRWHEKTYFPGWVTINNTEVTLPYTATYYEGDEITMQYHPRYGGLFYRWADIQAEGTVFYEVNPHAITITRDTTYEIDYTWYSNTVKVKTNDFNGGYGTVTIGDTTYVQESADTYAEGQWTDPINQRVTFKVVIPDAPSLFYSFYNWTIYNGSEVSYSTTYPLEYYTAEEFNPYTVTADIYRRFTFECYASPQTQGSAYIIIGSQRYTQFDFIYGESVTIYAEDTVEGYTFDHWSVESLDPTYLDVNQRSLTFTVNEHTVNAIGSHAFYLAIYKVDTKQVKVSADWTTGIPESRVPLYYNTDGSETYIPWDGDIEVNKGTTVYLSALLWIGETWQFQHWETGETAVRTTITPTDDYNIFLTYKATASPQLILMYGLLLIASGDTQIHPEKVATTIIQMGKFLL